jgi:PAS domain S-box-containing protein
MTEDNKKSDFSTKDFLDSSSVLSEIIDYLPDATMGIDKEGRVIIWNPAMEEMTGVKAADMIGKGNYEYALPFYKERRPILIDLALKPEDVNTDEKYFNMKKEGDILITEMFVAPFREGGSWLWAKAKPLYDAAGQIVGSIETVRDVTERHKYEEIFEQHTKELQEMSDNLRARESEITALKKDLATLRQKIQESEKKG